jgi:protein required for attachment to host cells
MKEEKTWILVADGAHARLVFRDGRRGAIKRALPYDFGAPHAPTRRFVSDRPGRFPAGTMPARHAIEPRTDRHDYEKLAFARDLATVIDRAAARGAFDRLVVVAPPAALGKLRTVLTPRTRALIAAEVAKDLTHVPLHALAGHLGHAF